MPVQAGSYYVMDRGYLDFARLYRLHQAGAFFVTRLKSNTRFYVAESRPVGKSCGLRCDQTITLNSPAGRAGYPEKLRRISFVDPETGNGLVFVSNQFDLDASIVAQIYRRRWAVELFSVGSNSTCGCVDSTAPRSTACVCKSGRPSAHTFSWPSPNAG